MTKYIKTYGINGLLEWYGTIEFGSMRVRASFTNGSVTAYGVAPATYDTDNELVQFIIENSKDFINGKIFLVNKTEVFVADEVKDENAENNVSESAEEEYAEESHEGIVVEVADKNEAIEYLKEHYGNEYTATKLRSKSAFDSACKECGVVFVMNE